MSDSRRGSAGKLDGCCGNAHFRSDFECESSLRKDIKSLHSVYTANTQGIPPTAVDPSQNAV
jgi:hypothetical protein